MNWVRFAYVFVVFLVIGMIVGGLAGVLGYAADYHFEPLKRLAVGACAGLIVALISASAVAIADQFLNHRKY